MDILKVRLGKRGRRTGKRHRRCPIACRECLQHPGPNEVFGPEHQHALLHKKPRQEKARQKKACHSSPMAKRMAGRLWLERFWFALRVTVRTRRCPRTMRCSTI